MENGYRIKNMATLKNGVMSGFRAHIANVVVYEMHGKTVLPSMPSMKQKQATSKRRQYQDDFRNVMKWMQALKPLIEKFWPLKPPQKSPFKQAFPSNLKAYRAMERPASYKCLQVSQGNYPGLSNLSFTILVSSHT